VNAARLARYAGHWLADAARFVGAIFYWNARKSVYVLRGRTSQCPCQNISDDSIPGRVRCDVILHWHDPARFQRICPLLVSTPEGWRCSVHASQVRPFWGRVARWCALSLLILYLAGTIVAFLGLRVVGHAPVSWTQVVWPGRWSEIRGVQSEHLFNHAIESFQQGRLNEAYLALTSSRQRDPSNYDATLLLAQVSMFQRSFSFADDMFANLWRDHPDQRARTAVVHHDTLLALDRMRILAESSVFMAKVDSQRAVVWVRSALLAIRSMGEVDAKAFATSQDIPLQALAPHAQLLLRTELALRRGGSPAEAVAALRGRFAGPINPFYTEYQITRLAELGAHTEAQALLDQLGPVIGPFDQLLTQVAIASIAGDQWTARGAFRSLLKQPLNPVRLERLACLLIAHPDAILHRELTARLKGDRTLESAASPAALWISGVICEAPVEASYWQTRAQQAGARYPDIQSVNFNSRNLADPRTVNHLVNVVSFPREVVIALLWRVAPQAAPVVRPIPASLL